MKKPTPKIISQYSRVNIDGTEYVKDPAGCYIPASAIRARSVIRTPKDGIPHLSAIRLSEVEIFVCIDLDGNNQPIEVREVTKGLANQTQIHPREVFRGAIQNNACSILLAHNHPSGNTDPSDADLVATKRIVETSKTIGISILDHLIVSVDSFVSIREKYPHYFC